MAEAVTIGAVHFTSELHWTVPTPATMPDADLTLLLWVAFADGVVDWLRGWWDSEVWRDAESGGKVDGEVLAYADVGPPFVAPPSVG